MRIRPRKESRDDFKIEDGSSRMSKFKMLFQRKQQEKKNEEEEFGGAVASVMKKLSSGGLKKESGPILDSDSAQEAKGDQTKDTMNAKESEDF